MYLDFVPDFFKVVYFSDEICYNIINDNRVCKGLLTRRLDREHKKRTSLAVKFFRRDLILFGYDITL